jgi:protein-S-isoprenylcysteine O-methyltransferase Ste14
LIRFWGRKEREALLALSALGVDCTVCPKIWPCVTKYTNPPIYRMSLMTKTTAAVKLSALLGTLAIFRAGYLNFYALAVIHAGYLIQLSFRQPSTKTVENQSESWVMWMIASPLGTRFARILTLLIAVHHATVSLARFSDNTFLQSDTVLNYACATPAYLNRELFTWSPHTLATLALLYAGSYIRFSAYAELGTNFTYRLAEPDQLVTSGLYAYVRHPSYTGLLAVLLAMYSLFFQQRGLPSCWAPLVDKRLVEDDRIGYAIVIVGFSLPVWLFMVKRVKEEERMMKKEFGREWDKYCKRTKKFVPFVY